MAYATLTTLQGIEYRQLFRWYIDLTDAFSSINKVLGFPAISNTDFCYLCESVGLPEKDIESTTASLKGVQVEVAGIATVKGTKDFTFLDNVSGDVLRALFAWQSMANNTSKESVVVGPGVAGTTGYTAGYKHSLTGGYKFSIPAFMLDSQKNTKLTCEFKGAWAKTVNPGGDLSSDSSELAKPIVTISYDNAYYF